MPLIIIIIKFILFTDSSALTAVSKVFELTV